MATTADTLTLRQRVGGMIAGNGSNGHAQEMIGRYVVPGAQASVFKARSRVRSIDETIADYEYWDKLRRGKAEGYSLGGLFCRRIESIFASWAFGLGVDVRLKEGAENPDIETDPKNYTDKELAKFLESLLAAPEDMGDDQDRESAVLLRCFEDHLGLGDQYIIINPDGTVSVPSPETVEVERAELDYRQILSVTVTTRLTGKTVKDIYSADSRRMEVWQADKLISAETYENLIGRIPVVQMSYQRSANETNGHSIHEPLRPLYDNYDNTLYKQLDGTNLLGNPLLTFEGMENLDDVINANDPATQDTYTDKDGVTEDRTQLNIDQNAVLLVGKGGSAKMTGPTVGFTADTQQSLKTLFLLLLDHTGIPEFIWGNELTSSRSSAEVQLRQWIMDVTGRQGAAGGWLLKLCTIWLQMKALTDPKIVSDTLTVVWPKLSIEDMETLLKVIQFAKDRGILTNRTTLELLELVDNPGVEAANAETEMEEQREKQASFDGFPDRLSDEVDFNRKNPDGSNI